MVSQFSVFRSSRFWPFFVAQFLGAANDNLLKTAFVVMMAYGIWGLNGASPEILVTLAAGVFILPFILFAPIAGHLADRHDKAQLIRVLKGCELGLVLFAIISLYAGSALFAFAMVFMLGAQSAFFSPVKYSILPQHLQHDELLAGNGLLSTGTYIAILSGTIIGTLLAPLEAGRFWISIVLLIFSSLGFLASLKIRSAPPAEREEAIKIRYWSFVPDMLRYIAQLPYGVLPAVLGVSWFYFVAGTFHAQFPNFARFTLGVDHIVLSVFMIVFTCGIALGGLLNNVFLKSKINARLVPLAGCLICVFSLDLYWVSYNFSPATEDLMSWADFISELSGVRIMIDLLGISMAGGLFIVPLRALIQERTVLTHRARVAALSSLSDALFILLASLIGALLLWAGLSIVALFALSGIVTVLAAVLLYKNQGLKMVLDHVVTDKG